MALQTTGPISLLNIATEFGGVAPHALSEYYGAGGLPLTGPLLFSSFYGLSAAYSNAVMYLAQDIVDIIDNNLAHVVATTIALAVTNTQYPDGTAPGNLVLRYGGVFDYSYNDVLTKIDKNGVKVGSFTNIGLTHSGGERAESINSIGLFTGWSPDYLVKRLNTDGALLSSVGTLHPYTNGGVGSIVDTCVMYYGGRISNYVESNEVRRVNSLGVTIGTVTSVGAARIDRYGCHLGSSLAVFFGGTDVLDYSSDVRYKDMIRIDSSGAQVGAVTTITGIALYTASITGAAGGTDAHAIVRDKTGIYKVDTNGAVIATNTTTSLVYYAAAAGI